MTQEEVAQYLSLSRSTVAQIEAGNRAVSSLELDRLASFFGQDIRDLLSANVDGNNALRAFFRAQTGVGLTSEMRSALTSWWNKARALTELENLLGFPQKLCTVAVNEAPLPSARWVAIQQGEHAGEEERARLGLGRAPIPSISDLLESQGVRTALESLSDDVSGLTLQGRGFGPLVVVNSNHPATRHRFSFAHEYAHVLMDRSRGGAISKLENRDDLIEIRANAFAASFLMPSDGVREAFHRLGKGFNSRELSEVYGDDVEPPVRVEGRAPSKSQDVQGYDVIRAADHFKVSRMAMIYRLKNLRLISNPELDALREREQSRYLEEMDNVLRAPPPNDAPQGTSAFKRHFLATALEAYRRSLISRGRFVELGELVGLSESDLTALQAAAGVSDDDDEPVQLREVG